MLDEKQVDIAIQRIKEISKEKDEYISIDKIIDELNISKDVYITLKLAIIIILENIKGQ